MMSLPNLLIENCQFSPVFDHPNGKLANHLSMTLIALNKMGANDERLQAFYTYYANRLQRFPDRCQEVEINPHNWRHYLGRQALLANYRAFFSCLVQEKGIQTVLSTCLGPLLEGMFEMHGLIRLAYAVESSVVEEVIAALAYFAAYYQAAPARQKPAHSFSFVTVNEALAYIQQRHAFTNLNVPGKTISERLQYIVNQDGFTDVIGFSFSPTMLPQFAHCLARLYAITSDFTVLHALTVTHALRLLLPYLLEHSNYLHCYWQLIAAIYIYAGRPDYTDHTFQTSSLESWQALFSKIILSQDVHTIKLAYSCFAENEAYGDPIYAYIAANLNP